MRPQCVLIIICLCSLLFVTDGLVPTTRPLRNDVIGLHSQVIIHNPHIALSDRAPLKVLIHITRIVPSLKTESASDGTARDVAAQPRADETTFLRFGDTRYVIHDFMNTRLKGPTCRSAATSGADRNPTRQR